VPVPPSSSPYIPQPTEIARMEKVPINLAEEERDQRERTAPLPP